MSTLPNALSVTTTDSSARAGDFRGGVTRAAWIAALVLLAVGPGAIGYSRCVWAAEALILVLFAACVLAGRMTRTPLDIFAGGWLATAVLSTLWAYHTGWGTHSPYPAELYAGGSRGPLRILIDTVASVLGAYALLWAIDGNQSTSARMTPVLWCAGVAAVFCAIEQTGNTLYGTADPRLQGTFTNPNLLGGFVCLTLPAAAALAGARTLARRDRIGCGVLSVALAAVLAGTQSRGAILGCGAAAIYLAACFWTSRGTGSSKRERRGRIASQSVVALSAALALCGLALFPHLLHESRTVSDDQRRTAWIAALMMIHSSPVAGLGIDSYPAAMHALHLKEMNPDTMTGLPLIPALHLHAHDLFLQLWLERGLAGLACALSLVFLVLRRAKRLLESGAPAPIAAGASAALIATLVQNLTDYTLWYAPIVILMWMMLAFALDHQAPRPMTTP